MFLQKCAPHFVLMFFFRVGAVSVPFSHNKFLDGALSIISIMLENCWPHTRQEHMNVTLTILTDCFKKRSLLALELFVNSNEIYISDRLELVKFRNLTKHPEARGIELREGNPNFNEGEADWKFQMLRKIRDVLQTHEIQIKLGDQENGLQPEGRRRRRGLMPLMIFTTVALGMILIPMGFQFLAVLGGKALLLAKLALILTAIQGLKKIATSDINYGLYHLPSNNLWNYDKQLQFDNGPRNTLEIGQPLHEHETLGILNDYKFPLVEPSN